jgi:hypothetical protein
MSSLETLEIAGVPLLLRSPANLDRHAPLILFWHGFGSPNGKADIAKTFPLPFQKSGLGKPKQQVRQLLPPDDPTFPIKSTTAT